MTESKEWVTIKVPKEIRDKAKEADGTYGELLESGIGSKDVGDSETNDETIYNMRDEIIGAINATSGDVATTEDLQHLTKQLDELGNQVDRMRETMETMR